MSTNPHASPLAVALFEAFARNGGNSPADHFDRNAAEQWMQQALDECMPKEVAAPVDLRENIKALRTYANGYYVRRDEVLAAIESTPAAPGIDLSKLQRYRVASDTNDVRNLYKDDTGTWVKIQDVERALIDASPKGGSEAKDADVYEYRQHYFSNAARCFTWTDWHSITREQYEDRLKHPMPDCEVRIRKAAMQATSAEVGA